MDRSKNYNWTIPPRLKVDWYDDFVSLINQIDTSLKNEEIARQQADENLLQLINRLIQTTTEYYVYVPFRNLVSSLISYSGTDWSEVERAGSYSKACFGLPVDKIVEVKYYTYYRAKMSNTDQIGYVKSRFKQTVPSGQYVETQPEIVIGTNWQHFSRVIDVPKEMLEQDGLFEAALLLKVDTGTIQAYMDRTFLLIKMKSLTL